MSKNTLVPFPVEPQQRVSENYQPHNLLLPTRVNVAAIKEQTDLRELAKVVTTLRWASRARGEMSGPCPKCGGTDRFHVSKTCFFCRQCFPPVKGQLHDVFVYAKWMYGLEFRAAAAWLSGGVAPSAVGGTKCTPERKQGAPARSWNADRVEKQLKADQLALWDDANTAAHSYLLGRGLTPNIWLAFGLGYRHRMGLPGTWDASARSYSYGPQPAIAIPWYVAGRLVAVRYRFLRSHSYRDIDGKKCEEKQTSRGTFADHVYSGHVLVYYGEPDAGCPDALSLRTLVICEGEINAMSIYQVAHTTGLDVISLGSESNNVPVTVASYARRYGAVLVWADSGETAKKWERQIGGPVHHITSEMCTRPDGPKRDANKLLQEGMLGYYLTTWRSQITPSKERLLRDLMDADGPQHLLDNGTRYAMSKLAAQLDKPEAI